MKFIVKKTEFLNGTVIIPASKSHTIRAVVIASLAEGQSTILRPLESEDTKAAINACINLGAGIFKEKNRLIIKGFSGMPKPLTDVLYLQNSGTSFNLMCGVVSLGNF
ncbi:MAG TPA: 3-phosphoshikimate 1-carboxyvinyltransferase, partial [bacterium]|nr:3-phosphoshikimate 1-carboxyvinyltransferase [bacterium]